MLLTLAFRHLMVHRGRALLLLLGYGLGVGVMIVLLSVGEAMLAQSRDVSLVSGGQVTVLPQGISVEEMRTGGASGLFFGIERARFLTRQLLGGERHAGLVRAVSPVVEQKLVYLRKGNVVLPVRAGAEIPSRARALGAGIRVTAGRWEDHAADSAWITPSPEQLYHELDRFHLPPVPDSTWAEWHYFNVAAGPEEWWYVTYLVGGAIPDGRWGGQLLVTHRLPGGRYERYQSTVPGDSIRLDTTRADLRLGDNAVTQRDGRYTLQGRAGALRLALTVTPHRHRYFPPVSLREGAYPSGYVVPALSATAEGEFCVAARCTRFAAAPAYHDHNWGVWREVTWDWGAAHGGALDLLYGAVYAPDDTLPANRTGAPRIFVALVDSAGVRQILRAREVRYAGRHPGSDRAGAAAPASFTFVAARDADTVTMAATILDFQASRTTSTAATRRFLQMRGRFTLRGRIAGRVVADSGTGFFETYVE
ncbi:MAG: hypothetical protein IPK12_21790 [Gemmatimonadetes bacterium]|nr:hypothetical protein [Gemmatimonadota bacterium]